MRVVLPVTLGVPELIATIPALPNANEGSLNRLSVGVPPPVLEAEEAEGRDGRAVVGEAPSGEYGAAERRALPCDDSLRRNSTHIWEKDYRRDQCSLMQMKDRREIVTYLALFNLLLHDPSLPSGPTACGERPLQPRTLAFLI